MLKQEELDSLIEDMYCKMEQHKHKGDTYKTEQLTALYNMLQVEVNELGEALQAYLHAPLGQDVHESKTVQLECADVANFAAFLHSRMK